MSGGCCAPGRDGSAPLSVPAVTKRARRSDTSNGMIQLAGGRFRMGNHQADGYADDGEGPVHEVELNPFQVAQETVTNDRFHEFIAATGYMTEAERFGWSYVFAGLLPERFPPTRGAAQTPWWRQVFGATWQTPEGPQSNLAQRGSHPVVHVSWNDAIAFCDWDGSRLPTEAEWEYAARGGTSSTHFSWGDDLIPNGKHRMNVWQGTFPTKNTGGDGHKGTAPARSYQPNEFGLYNMTGNVWEWCADWFDPGYYAVSPSENSPGPDVGSARVMRGGSYLCHRSYCNRYRVDSRSSNTPDSSAGNIGFRCVRDV
ncbi:MAG: formylglycine-generating enzyme family protein [Thermomicrobiales bacterium]